MRQLITSGPKAGRQPCCIMGCRRTFKDEGYSEVICSQHWRLVPSYMRRRHRLLVARYTRQFGDNAPWIYPAGSPKRLHAVRLQGLYLQAWRLIKDAATDRTMGL